METTYLLQPKNCKNKSFYGKAKVVEEYGTKSLISYKSCICQIKTVGLETKVTIYDVHDYYGKSLTFSRTSTLHLKEFLIQNGYCADSTNYIKEHYTIVDGGQTDASRG